MHMPLQRVWNEATKSWDIEHKIGFFWYNALIYVKENGNYRRLSEDEIDEMKWHTKLVEVIDGEGKVYDGRGNLLKTA